MKRKLTEMITRSLAFVLSLGIASGAWAANDVTLGTPEVTWGADFTNAVVTATVTDGYTDVAYTLTYGQTTVAGTVAGTTVTFNVPVAENARYANFDYSIAAKVNNASVGSASGSAIVADEKAWFSTTANKTTNGAWTTQPTVAGSKMTFTESNTFTPTPAPSGKIVVIDMGNVCFGDTNDAEISDAQAGIRIGENGKFEVLTPNNDWQETSVAADGATEYNVVVTINYTTKKYSVKVGENTISNIDLAGDKTQVASIEFQGDGSLESLTGEYYDGAMVKDSADKTYDTVAEAIAALKAGTATAPLTILHDGIAPAGWTIDKNGKLDTAQAEVVIDETPTETNPVTVSVAVPKACTADGLIDTENRAAGDILKVWSKTDECYYTWELTSAKEWKPRNTYVITETGATTHSKAASEFNLKAGQAVWVTITTSASVKLKVTYNAAPVAVAVESGWNLVAPTTPGGTTVNDIIKSTGAADNDSIVVPTKTVPKVYTKVNGAWGYTTIVEVETPNGLKIGRSVHKVEDTTIKAGTGVWFVNGSSDSKNINL